MDMASFAMASSSNSQNIRTSTSSVVELRLPAFNFELERETGSETGATDGFLNETPELPSLATPHHHSAAPGNPEYRYTGQGTSHSAPDNTDKNEPESWMQGSSVHTSLLPSPSLTSTTSSSSSSDSSSYISQPQYPPPPSPPPQHLYQHQSQHQSQYQYQYQYQHQNTKQVPRKPIPPTKEYIPYSPPPVGAPPAPTTTPPPIPEDAFPDRNSPVQLIISSAPTSPVHEKESGPVDRFAPKSLQKASTMPVIKPPPVPVPEGQPSLSTPIRAPNVPVVTATEAAPSAARDQQNRSPSPDHPPPSAAKLQPNRLQPRHPSPAPRGRSVSAQHQHMRGLSADGFRAVSNPLDTRASSTNSGEGSPTSMQPDKKISKKRKTWLPGSRSRSNSTDTTKKGSGAWIMCPDAQVDYNATSLLHGEKVPELWNEAGNVFIYLHPRETGIGPSFKVSDHVFSSSLALNELLLQGLMENASISSSSSSDFLQVDDAELRQQRPAPARNAIEGHLYLPLGSADIETLVAARNLFAFLTNQPLVGTPANPSLFAAIINIARLLRQLNFTEIDGSSFGQSVDAAFDLFMDQFSIADVRHSGEKTIEALVMGEHMKSWNLYNEAFTHAVGKYESLLALNSPTYAMVSPLTKSRLERAHLDLLNRQSNVNSRIEAFEYPSLFAGIANSTSHEEYRNVRFKEWRNSFGKMRSFVQGYYKDLFGSWPPKARSKKNHFTQSGLNRQCLKMLYSDLCALYDLLVDRQSITPRVIDQLPEDKENEEEKKKKTEKEDIVAASISALRIMLTEFERSSPPVLPPIPFDIPKIPSMTSIYETYNDLPAKKQAKFDKNLQPHELQLLLIKSHNIDTDALQMPFLLAFKEFEVREAKGVHPRDLLDQRLGYWLFLYVTLQSLPILVVDAPGLHFTEGAEYFLCGAPQGNPPWIEDAGEVRKMWYQTADQNIVELSADVVLFSSEGIYMRSHCWLAGKEWEQNLLNGGPGTLTPPLQQNEGGEMFPGASPLQPPRAVFQDMDPAINNNLPNGTYNNNPHQRRDSGVGSTPNSPRLRPVSRSGSPASSHRARHAYRASIAIGLEPLPLLPDGSPISRAPSGASSPGLMDHYGVVGGGGGLGVNKLRVSRSAVNLGQQHQLYQQQQGQGDEQYQQQLAGAPRQVSYGGLMGAMAGVSGAAVPPHPNTPPPPPPVSSGSSSGHERKDSLTFDDILKGMDKGEKKKKKLFF